MGSALSYNALPEMLLDLARRAGTEAAEVFQSSSWSQPVFFEANRLKQLESSESEGTALRIWRNGRPGLAVAHGSVDPQLLLDKALALSALNDPEAIVLAPPTGARYSDMGQSVPIDQLLSWGEEIIHHIRSAYPEVLCRAELECDIETIRLINSLGLDLSYSDTTLSSYASAEWVRGDDLLDVSDGQIRRNSLDPHGLAEHILQRLDWAKSNVASPRRRIPIVFSAKAADMLWGTVQAALSGKRVLERSSPWSDRIGQQVVSTQITLSQHPDLGPFSCPFDDEGAPTQALSFIENGVLRLFYTDHAVGQELGGGSTGNGFRPGLSSYPTPALFNTLVQPGNQSLEALVGSLDEGLLVDQILGGGPGISGDFSVNIELGYYIRGGEIMGRVKDTMVAGNVYAALNQLLALGGDGDWNGSCYTPSVIVSGLSVTGR